MQDPIQQAKDIGFIDFINPTKQDLDNALRDYIQAVDLYNLQYKDKKVLELFFEKEVDAIVNDKDEAGKKLFTYPANARSKVDQNNRAKADYLVNLSIQCEQGKLNIEKTKVIYYHVKNNMTQNTMQDIQSQIVGGMEY